MTSGARFPQWWPYVLPYGLFLLLSFGAAKIPGVGPWAYPVKTALVAATLLFFVSRGAYPELSFRPSLLGIVVGVAGYLLWVLPEGILSFLPKLGDSSFDPHAMGEAWLVPLASVRVIGAVLLVPVFEELFLRSFLLRWLEDEDFRSVALGRYRLLPFLGVVLAMALTHDRWLRGGLYSALMCGLLYREKRMGPVIWAHAVTNLLLAIHVLGTGTWSLW